MFKVRSDLKPCSQTKENEQQISIRMEIQLSVDVQ